MRTLPTLPGCGQPATIRIEMYTAGLLDGSLYVCPSHATDATTAAKAAGLTVHQLSGGAGVQRCGDGLDFTGTGAPATLTAPTPRATTPVLMPACGQPATARIEIYSSADGHLYGSLDASAYTCVDHEPDVTAAIRVAGLTPYRSQWAANADRTCGYMFVFETDVR